MTAPDVDAMVANQEEALLYATMHQQDSNLARAYLALLAALREARARVAELEAFAAHLDERLTATVAAPPAAQGEPVAWGVEFKRHDETEWSMSGPWYNFDEAYDDQSRLLLHQWPANIIPLYAAPVRVTEEMFEAAEHAYNQSLVADFDAGNVIRDRAKYLRDALTAALAASKGVGE